MAIIPSETIPFAATFLFVFGIVFGLLIYSKVGNFGKRVSAAIALAIALFAIMYQPLVVGMTQYMPIAIAILIPLFFIIFVKKILEGGDKVTDTFPIIVSMVILGMIGYLVEDKLRAMVPPGIGIDPANFVWVIGIVMTLVFFWLVYKTNN